MAALLLAAKGVDALGAITSIQWTATVQPDGTVTPGKTYNPWQGCTKVSPGCAACYMYRDHERYGKGELASVVRRSSPATFNAPLRWERDLIRQAAGAAIVPQRVFACSWSDWFHEDADAWRDEAWAIIRQTPHLTYQILTKRPERIASHLPADWGSRGYPNVWLGVSAEYQRQLTERTSLLAAVPAAIRFVSLEPLLGPVSYFSAEHLDAFHWLIIGGESGGKEARPFDPEWALAVIASAREDGPWRRTLGRPVAIFVKQLGSRWAREHHARDGHGGDPDEWPAALRVREFPSPAMVAAAS